jgi:hypothetical protein
MGHTSECPKRSRPRRSDPARDARCAAAGVQRLPPRFQRGAPAQCARRSRPGELIPGLARPYPEQLTALEYSGHFLVKRVTNASTIRFKDRLLFIANALKQHHIAFEEVDDGVWSIYLRTVLLARLDEVLTPRERYEPLDVESLEGLFPRCGHVGALNVRLLLDVCALSSRAPTRKGKATEARGLGRPLPAFSPLCSAGGESRGQAKSLIYRGAGGNRTRE